jgi:hypothetical protein
MSNERDELFQLILGRTTTKAVERILAAGYRKPRTITTAKELDALPVGTVVRTSGDEDRLDPRIAVKTGFWTSESEWEVADSNDFCLDSGELDDLPATVLYEPEAAK